MCPIVNELKKREKFDVKVVVTGQHRKMLDQVLESFEVVPDYDLSIMKLGQTLFDVTANVLSGIKAVLEEVMPDVILVHGDTSSAFSAALSGFYIQIPIGHVEAGLRTYNINNPYPEEFNRRAIALLASYHFAPTALAAENLVSEGVDRSKIYVTGNTVIDALKTTVSDNYSHPELRFGERLVILTAHRRESLGQPMRGMFRAAARAACEFEDIRILYPVHENPVIRAIAEEELSDCERVCLIPPLSVKDFHNLLARCYIVLTDSGGVQEESAFLGKPVLVMRNDTERKEMLSNGCMKLVGTDEDEIYNAFRELLLYEDAYKKMAMPSLLYGDGFASKRIADVLEKQ